MKYIKLFENFDGFKEITFSLTQDDMKEVMFDILSSGKVIGIYCYNDGIPEYWVERIEDTKPMKTKPGKNSLFVHISVNKTNISRILIDGGAIPSIENTEDFELLMNMLKYYDIDHGVDTGDWVNMIDETFLGRENTREHVLRVEVEGGDIINIPAYNKKVATGLKRAYLQKGEIEGEKIIDINIEPKFPHFFK